MSLFSNLPVYNVADRPPENGETIYIIDVTVYKDERVLNVSKAIIEYIWAKICPDTGYIDEHEPYVEGDRAKKGYELVLIYDGVYEPLTLNMQYALEKDIDRIFNESTF